MNKLKHAIIEQIDKEGLAQTAILLGEPTTRNIQEWIKPDKDIPESKKGMIEKILKLEGVI